MNVDPGKLLDHVKATSLNITQRLTPHRDTLESFITQIDTDC